MSVALSLLPVVLDPTDSVGNVCGVLVIADQTITAPSGWTQLDVATVGNLKLWWGFRTETAGDPGKTYVWTLGAFTDKWAVMMVSASGIQGTDGTNHNIQVGVTTLTANSLTTANDGDIIIAYWLVEAEVAITLGSVPAGLTSLAAGSSRGPLSSAVMVAKQTTHGATGGMNVTLDSSANGIGIQAGFRGVNTALVNLSAFSS